MSNVYLEAPNRLATYSKLDRSRTVFLAGSITGALEWQKNAADILLPHFNVFNPRRNNYSTLDPAVEKEQITWEHTHLEIAGITLFYFRPETLAPITLFEFGKQLREQKYAPWRKTYITIDPEYKRRNDVLFQAELEIPELLVNIFNDPKEMYARIIQENA